MNRVLIVEDEPATREVVSALTVLEGWKPRAVGSGEEALEVLRSEDSFDLAVLDLMLPAMSGMELLAHLHRQFPDTMIVVVTAFSSVDGAVEAMRSGAHDYMTKPFKNEELVLALHHALEAGRVARESKQIREQLRERYIQDRVAEEKRGWERAWTSSALK